MWVVIPVKPFDRAKSRLATVLSSVQRAELSYLMLDDIVQTLCTCNVVEGVSLVSSDRRVRELAERHNVNLLLTRRDKGLSRDVLRAITALGEQDLELLAIIPADVPQLGHEDLVRLRQSHAGGLTLCPALIDGGTNALLFTPPLPVPLVFGVNSLNRFRMEAERARIPVLTLHLAGLERDIDRPADLAWLQQQAAGGQAWAYTRKLELPADARNILQSTDN